MKISVSMYSLATTIKKEHWSVEQFIDYASMIAIDGVELLDVYWENKADITEELDRVRVALKKYNLRVSAYDIMNSFVKETREERAEEVTAVVNAIQVAKKLGTNIVRIFCGDAKEDLTFEKGFAWIIESLKECARTAEKEQVYLAIENHGLLAGKSRQVKEIIDAVNSPYVKSTFDTGNFLLVHEKPTKAFEQLKNDIVHVHFKDFRAKTANESVRGFLSTDGLELIGVIPGDGEVDLNYIVEGLKNIHYDGWLSIEYEGHDDAKKANAEAVNRLRNLLN
ncbi:sugar phosphate isomerase/epimerase [Sporosarcina saromensis]|uniref:Sugar phosphate isomerase/epimerase n=1 Tax=Sporosarcina saromensis TaxID=359365 RepID=A0ABU4G635_9BACL|nr:sugar phosphate isomerase/epimerase [Sporosarcina saromensis]MDW0112428.1 sugar phosphate isomerase/epimerase [Sporosarcina saromensis]